MLRISEIDKMMFGIFFALLAGDAFNQWFVEDKTGRCQWN
jgi:hypothetical protein